MTAGLCTPLGPKMSHFLSEKLGYPERCHNHCLIFTCFTFHPASHTLPPTQLLVQPFTQSLTHPHSSCSNSCPISDLLCVAYYIHSQSQPVEICGNMPTDGWLDGWG